MRRKWGGEGRREREEGKGKEVGKEMERGGKGERKRWAERGKEVGREMERSGKRGGKRWTERVILWTWKKLSFGTMVAFGQNSISGLMS